jgi:hypothetical protein
MGSEADIEPLALPSGEALFLTLIGLLDLVF